MISIVTITFNNCTELKQTLESIKGIPDSESVVINGGFSEDSLEYLKSHSGVVVNERDDGISDAFNKGYRYASGKAVVFLNSGDLLLDREYYGWANRVLSEDSEVAFVYSDIEFMDPIAGPILMKPRGLNRNDLGKGMPFPHPSMVVRREIFDQIGGFSKDFKIAMDFDFVVRMLAAGHRGVYYPKVTVRMDGAGVSTISEVQGIEECRKSLITHGEFDGKNRIDFETRLIKYQIRRVALKVFGNLPLKLFKVLKSKIK